MDSSDSWIFGHKYYPKFLLGLKIAKITNQNYSTTTFGHYPATALKFGRVSIDFAAQQPGDYWRSSLSFWDEGFDAGDAGDGRVLGCHRQ